MHSDQRPIQHRVLAVHLLAKSSVATNDVASYFWEWIMYHEQVKISNAVKSIMLNCITLNHSWIEKTVWHVTVWENMLK